MEINIDTILAIVGVIATILIGYLGVRYTLKYRKKTDIIFLKNSSISLFKSIVKNLDDIEINFKGKRIDENLIVFKGTFFNNGNVDIDNSIVHKPLELELPENYSWVNQKIIGCSDGLEVELTQTDNKIVFNWDLFKEGEYITFDSLVEFKSNNDNKEEIKDISKGLLKGITFNHRITNLKGINKEGAIPRPMPFGGMLFLSILLLSIVIGGYYISIGQYFFPSYQVYNEINIDSTQYFVQANAENEHQIKLTSTSGEEIKTVTKEEYKKLRRSDLLLKKKEINYWRLIIVGLFSTLYLIGFFAIVITEFRQRRLYKKLKIVAEKYDDLDFEDRRQVGFKLFEFKFK